MIMCCLKAAQMYGLSFRAAKELVKPLSPFLPNGKNILFLTDLSSLSSTMSNSLAAPPLPSMFRCFWMFWMFPM